MTKRGRRPQAQKAHPLHPLHVKVVSGESSGIGRSIAAALVGSMGQPLFRTDNIMISLPGKPLA